MGLKMKLATASGAAILAVSVGSAHAVKGPAGACSANYLKLVNSYTRAIYGPAAKYCFKAPNAVLAAKMGGKLENKVNRLVDRYNTRFTKLGCDTESDPDASAGLIPTPVLAAGEGEALLLSVDEVCNGVDDNP